MAYRHRKHLSAALLLAVCSAALGVENAPTTPAGEALERAFPGVRFHEEAGRLTSIYGVPMTAGATAVEAATTWINQYGAAFGAGNLELTETWSCPIQDDRFTVFTYQQYVSGIPVEYGMLKVLVLNGQAPRVVYASGTLAMPPANGLNLLQINDAQARSAVARTQPRSMSQWSNPVLTVYQGEGPWTNPVLTWKITGESPNPSDALCRTFFVNATTGAIEAVRNEIIAEDVTGSVHGMGTPGLLPDTATNLPVSLSMSGIKVGITGGNTAVSDRSGNFTIPNTGTDPVTVGSGVGTASGFGGLWANVVPSGVTALTLSLPNVVPPGPAPLLFNPTPAATTTAQVNAFIVTNAIHDYFRDRAPNFTGLDVSLRVNTGVAGTCNAFFSAGANPPTSSSTNFYNAGGGCPNTAYTTVAAHEYGHFIVNRLGRSQGAFGEGYGDTSGELLYDDNGTGRGFNTAQPTSPLRDPLVSNVQYPCSNPDPHYCGMMLSGVWWRMRTNMGSIMGSQPGLDFTRQLEVSWSLVTVGGPGGQAIAAQTAIEVLTIDDNDGNIANGTPHYPQICPAFAAHNVQCPTITQTCYANCDASTTAPVLNVNDFICFQAAFAAGGSYANCDNSTTVPVLNVNDFICFQAKFAAGCP